MANELYIHTLRQLRDGCLAENMDTEAEALEAAIQALSCDGDCISRQAAIDVAIDAINEWGGGWDAEREVRDAINALPSAQPEIIRCKDCRYAHLTYDGECKYCDMWTDVDGYLFELYVDGTFYCGNAERRTDGGHNQQTGGD